MATRNIEMNIKTNDGYDILYPATNSGSIQSVSDDVNELFGTNGSLDDILTKIGQYNLYWWKRRPVSYSIGSYSNKKILQCSTTYGGYYIYRGYNIEYDATISSYKLVNPIELELSYDDFSSSLNGYYFTMSGRGMGGGTKSTDLKDNVIYKGSGSISKSSSGGDYYLYQNCAEITSSVGNWSYTTSSNREANVDYGLSGMYEYSFLGKPFEKMPEISKMEVGSYIGTGVHGESNPNSLTFDFVVKILGISSNTGTVDTFNAIIFPWTSYLTISGGFTSTSDDDCPITRENEGKTISWYNDQSGDEALEAQGNVLGQQYFYIAIR